jgi:hypothetical protein
LNHQLDTVIRFKFREGKWQFEYLESDKMTRRPVPDAWRSLGVSIDTYESSMTWDGKTLFPILVRDTKAADKRAGHKQVPDKTARTWVAKNRKADWTYSQTVAAVMEGTGCTRPVARAATKGGRHRGERVQRNAPEPNSGVIDLAHLAKVRGKRG